MGGLAEANRGKVEGAGTELQRSYSKTPDFLRGSNFSQTFVDAVEKARLAKIEADRQAKLAEQAKILAQAKKPATAPVLAPQVINGCGDNQYANFIYMKESGCNLNARNSIGCYGIGQACPGSKLPCGADYACQNAYFTNYAISRYGSWYNAYLHWVQRHWW